MPRAKSKWDIDRWKGRRPNSQKGYYWRKVCCPFCGCSYYKDINIKQIFDNPWQDVAQVMRLEAELREANNDYSQPVHRGSVLGRMHQYKVELWEKHLRECGDQAYALALEYKLVSNDAEFQQLVDNMIDNKSAICVFEHIEWLAIPF